MKLEDVKREYEVSIIDGLARTLWVMAYADFAANNGRCAYCGETIIRDDDEDWVDSDGNAECPDNDDVPDEGRPGPHDRDDEFWPVSGSGEDWDDKATTTPAGAYTCANQIIAEFVRRESSSLADIFEVAATIHLGEFQWYEEGSRSSEVKRDERHAKHELAEAFGSGLAHEALRSGCAWGDSHKTRRNGMEIQFDLPDAAFEIVAFDLVTWSVQRVSGSDSVAPNISIGGTVPEPNQRYMGDEEIEIDRDDLRGESVPEFIADAMRDQLGGGTLEPSSDTYVDGVFYRGEVMAAPGVPLFRQGPPTKIVMALNGVMPFDREWTYYFVTKKIGRIHLVNTPSAGTGRFDRNVLFWFGQISPTLVLVFGSGDISAALDDAVDYLQNELEIEGYFCDEEVEQNRHELVREYANEQGFPDESLIGDRMLDVLRDEAEEGTTTAGNNGRRLRIDEHGVYGQELELADLRRIGSDGADLQAGYHHNPTPMPVSSRGGAGITMEKIPIRTRTSAAQRSRQ